MTEPKPIIKTEYYLQPVLDGKFHRILDDKKEFVSYLMNASARIWLNRETKDFDTHWHPALEIIMPLENRYTAIIDGSAYTLSPGDILIIPSGKTHKLKAPSSGSRMIYLFDPEAFARIRTFAYLRPLLMDPVLITEKSAPEMHGQAREILLKVGNAYFEAGDLRELVVYSYMLQFFVVFGEHHLAQIRATMNMSEKKKKAHHEKFEMVIARIDERFQERLSLEQMAEFSNLSKYHFSRLFKEYTNQTFYTYLTRRRIDAAISLLSGSDKSVSEIAMQTGFMNIASFNRAFKKILNCSPRVYKKHEEIPQAS